MLSIFVKVGLDDMSRIEHASLVQPLGFIRMSKRQSANGDVSYTHRKSLQRDRRICIALVCRSMTTDQKIGHSRLAGGQRTELFVR